MGAFVLILCHIPQTYTTLV